MTKLIKFADNKNLTFQKTGKKKVDCFFNRVSRQNANTKWVKDSLVKAEIDEYKDSACLRTTKR